jgi:hypothetical protein
LFDKSARKDDTFSRDDFVYDHGRDVYYCPGDNTLMPWRQHAEYHETVQDAL